MPNNKSKQTKAKANAKQPKMAKRQPQESQIRRVTPESAATTNSQGNTLKAMTAPRQGGGQWSPAKAGAFLTRVGVDDEVFDYTRSLINPEAFKGQKIPDSLNVATATYQTIITIPITGNTAVGTAPTDNGRFFIAIQPVITDAQLFDPTNMTSTVVQAAQNVIWSSPMTAANTVLTNDPNIQQMVPNRAVPRTGLMVRARPVSMSAWFQYEGDLISNGGQIAAALVTGDTWAENLTTVTSGNLMNWENLANYPTAFQGKLCDGTYSYYMPFGPGDYEFRPVDKNAKTRPMFQYDYSTIMIAGQAFHPGNAAAGQAIGRVRICINFEYMTDMRVTDTVPSPVIPLALMLAAKILAGQPTSIPNDEHQSFLSKLLTAGIAGVAGWFVGGPATALLGVMGALGAARVSGTIMPT